MDQVCLTQFYPTLGGRHGGQMRWGYSGQHEGQIPVGGGEIDAVKAGGGVASAVPGEPGGGRVENTKSIREIVNMNIVSKERNTSTNKTIIFKISSISNTIEITY